MESTTGLTSTESTSTTDESSSYFSAIYDGATYAATSVSGILSGATTVVTSVSGVFTDGVKGIVYTATNNPSLKDLEDLLSKGNEASSEMVANAFYEQVCKVKDTTHFSYSIEIKNLTIVFTFFSVDIWGKMAKNVHNFGHTPEDALSLATVLKHDLVRQKIIEKCKNNNDAREGIYNLSRGHDKEAGEILGKMVKEFLKI